MKKIRPFLLAAALAATLAVPACALEYSVDAPENYLFGRPTSDNTIYEWENPNVDRSKNTALIPPGFGTPTSYLPNSGEYLTPNLVPGALSGGLVNAVGSAAANATGGVAGSSVIAGSSSIAGGNGVTLGSDGFQTLYQYGIFRGTGEIKMKPGGSTTRAQFAAFIHRIYDTAGG